MSTKMNGSSRERDGMQQLADCWPTADERVVDASSHWESAGDAKTSHSGLCFLTPVPQQLWRNVAGIGSQRRRAGRALRKPGNTSQEEADCSLLWSSASGALYLDGNLHVLPGKTNACWDKLKKQFSHKTPALNTAAGTQVLCVRSEAGLVRDTSDVQTREIDQELNWRICAHYFSCFPSFSFRAVTRLQHQSLSLPFI